MEVITDLTVILEVAHGLQTIRREVTYRIMKIVTGITLWKLLLHSMLP